jgi:hypothetical protein
MDEAGGFDWLVQVLLNSVASFWNILARSLSLRINLVYLSVIVDIGADKIRFVGSMNVWTVELQEYI